MWLFFLLNAVAFGGLAPRHGLGRFDGLTERLFLLSALGWMAVVALAMRRTAPGLEATGTTTPGPA